MPTIVMGTPTNGGWRAPASPSSTSGSRSPNAALATTAAGRSRRSTGSSSTAASRSLRRVCTAAGRAPRLRSFADLGAAGALAAGHFRCRRRWIDEPMPIVSRYLTTVRRATSKPLSLRRHCDGVIAEDVVSAANQILDAGFHRFGGGALAFGRCDARTEEIFELEHAPLAQQIFVRGHAAAVDSCMPMASATSRSVIGRSADTPAVKKPRCRSTIALTTLTIVRARWSSALTSQLRFGGIR